MESGIQSSFIPHNAGVPDAAPHVIRRDGGGFSELLVLLAVVLCVASVALAAAVFLYTQFLGQQSTSKQQQLKIAESEFEPSLIEQITQLDDRMQVASQILASHIAPSVIFDALDQTTLQTMSFQSLNIDATDPKAITLKMTGVAQSVNSIAYQADLFGKSNIITDPIFSNIDRQPDGVHFNLTALIDPSSILYEQLAQQSASAGASAAAATTGTLPTAQTSSTASGTSAQLPSNTATTSSSSGH